MKNTYFFDLSISIGWLPASAQKTEQMTDISSVLHGGLNILLLFFYFVVVYVICCSKDQNCGLIFLY